MGSGDFYSGFGESATEVVRGEGLGHEEGRTMFCDTLRRFIFTIGTHGDNVRIGSIGAALDVSAYFQAVNARKAQIEKDNGRVVGGNMVPGLVRIGSGVGQEGTLSAFQQAGDKGGYRFFMVDDKHRRQAIVEIGMDGQLVVFEEMEKVVAPDTAVSARGLENLDSPGLSPFSDCVRCDMAIGGNFRSTKRLLVFHGTLMLEFIVLLRLNRRTVQLC